MRNSILFVYLLLCFQPAYSQVWIDDGATWHYGFWGHLMEGNVTLNYDRDTIIDGIECQVIEGERHLFLMDEFGDISGEEQYHFSTNITYASNDTVFYRNGEEFFVLFDFGAEVGDSWVIANESNPTYPSCNDISNVKVAGTGSIEIDGVSYRYIDLETDVTSSYGLNGRFIERFGQSTTSLEQFQYLFPVEYGCEAIPDDVVTEFPYFSFRCYQDDSFSLYNPLGVTCAEVLNLPVNEVENKLEYFPNPARSSLQVNTNTPIEIVTIHTLTGQILATINVNSNTLQIDVSEFPAGMYLLYVQLSNGSLEKRNFIVN